MTKQISQDYILNYTRPRTRIFLTNLQPSKANKVILNNA